MEAGGFRWRNHESSEEPTKGSGRYGPQSGLSLWHHQPNVRLTILVVPAAGRPGIHRQSQDADDYYLASILGRRGLTSYAPEWPALSAEHTWAPIAAVLEV